MNNTTLRVSSLLLIAYCLLLLSTIGCSVLLVPKPRFNAHPPPADLLKDTYHDYAGVIHIHTRYSDGAGTYEQIARVANAQRLDYLIVTDHNTLKPLRDGKQGWYGTTLVLVGTEISTRGGHYLAIGVTEEIDRSKLTTQQIIDEVNRQGGLGFIAHPYYTQRRWTDWTVNGFTGIEAYNVAHDTLEENKLRLVVWTLTVPTEPFYLSIIDRPYDPLSTWDQLIARHDRHIVGIGSSDAHEVRVFGVKFAPYEVMFQLIRTHLLIPQGASLTPELVYDALRKGHAYLAIELVSEAKGFSFYADNGSRVLGIMGDDVVLEPDLQLTTVLPSSAQLILFRDGQPCDTATGQSWHVAIDKPGVYRVEVSVHGKPWIYSNPIYIHPASESQQPAISNQQTAETQKDQPSVTSDQQSTASHQQPAETPRAASSDSTIEQPEGTRETR